ncbi:MAG: FAD-dependent monooxygenase [Caldimonas sp.]
MPLTAKQQQFLDAWILGNQSRSVFTKARQTIGGSVESEAKEFSKKRGKALAALGALGDDMAQVKAELQGRMDVIDAGADLGHFKNQVKLLERIVTDAAEARMRQDQLDGQQAALERLVKAASAGKGKGRPDPTEARLDDYARLILEAQASFRTYDGECAALKTYLGTLTTEILQDIQDAPRLEAKAKDDLRVAKAIKVTKANEKQVAEAIARAQAAVLTAPEQATNLTGLKKQLEEQWGSLMGLRAETRTHLQALVSSVHAVSALRNDGSAETAAKRVGLLDEMKPRLGQVQGEVYRFGEKMVEMQRRMHDHARTDPASLIAMPSEPSTVVDVDAPDNAVDVLTRLHATEVRLLKDPLRTDLLAKQALIKDILKVPVPAEAATDAAAYRDGLVKLAMASRLDALKVGAALRLATTPAKTAAFATSLVKAGSYETQTLADFVQGAQEWVVEVESKFGSLIDFAEKVAAAGLEKFDAKVERSLKLYLNFPAELVGGSVITRTTASGEREAVKLASSGRIIVVGGGPIGLMSAIEAAKQGGRVTLYEGRANEYARQNVLKLTKETVNRLERYGVYKGLGLSGDDREKIRVADLEDTLFAIVKGLGIRVVKGKGVSELSKDPDTGEMLCLVDGVHEVADLVVVAVGSGVKDANKYAKGVVMSEQLGISVKGFELTDHVISANLDKGTHVPHAVGEKTAQDKKAWEIVLETPTQKYVLAQLTPKEYADAQSSKDKLKAIIRERAKVNPEFANLDIQDVGRFEVKIQRADKFRGDDLSAVVVGDSAATPHPESGSGTNVGALEVDAVADLVRGLVDSANARFGKRREKVEASLDSYDGRMQEIVEKQTRRGIQNMISVRYRRANLSRQMLADWRRPLEITDDSKLDEEVTRILSDMSRELPKLSPPSTDPLFDDWDAAKKRGTLLEELNEGLEKLLVDAQKQQRIDKTQREALLRRGLEALVYKPS